jgi:hypothetical protein
MNNNIPPPEYVQQSLAHQKSPTQDHRRRCGVCLFELPANAHAFAKVELGVIKTPKPPPKDFEFQVPKDWSPFPRTFDLRVLDMSKTRGCQTCSTLLDFFEGFDDKSRVSSDFEDFTWNGAIGNAILTWLFKKDGGGRDTHRFELFTERDASDCELVQGKPC